MYELLFSRCVFCNNKNINFLEKSFRFRTASECGHQICSHCYDKVVFKEKKVVECPGCKNGRVIKKTQLSDKSKEELDYLKEVNVRNEVLQKFNLDREDFPDEQSFQNYRERAEQIVWCKLNGQNEQWADEEIQKNEAEHGARIARRAAIRADNNRRFKEQEREEKIRKREELKLIILRERSAYLEKQLEKAEGNQVALGELKATTVAQRKAERLKMEREQRERDKAAIEQGYGPQVIRYLDQEALWPRHQLDAQPKKEKRTFASEYDQYEMGALRNARRIAGGIDKTAAQRRTREIMLAGLC